MTGAETWKHTDAGLSSLFYLFDFYLTLLRAPKIISEKTRVIGPRFILMCFAAVFTPPPPLLLRVPADVRALIIY